MKKDSPTKLEWLALIGVLLAICGGLFYSGKQAWDSELAAINQSQKPKKSPKKQVKKPYQATWGWPFKKIGKNGPKYEEGQQYGKTKYCRRVYPTKSYWHDGWDFASPKLGKTAKFWLFMPAAFIKLAMLPELAITFGSLAMMAMWKFTKKVLVI